METVIQDFGKRYFLSLEQVVGPFAAEMQRPQDRVLAAARAFGAWYTQINRLQDVDFARGRPAAIAILCREHPDRGPGALPLGQSGANFNLAITPGSLAARIQPRRAEGACRLGIGGCRIAAQVGGQRRTGRPLMARSDDQFAVFYSRVARTSGVALVLLVATAPAIFIEAPVGAINLFAIEFIRPNHGPVIGVLRCRGHRPCQDEQR